MLTSFFGDLSPTRRLHEAGSRPDDGDARWADAAPDSLPFTQTAVFDRDAGDRDAAEGDSRDRRSREWLIDGAPAEAIRRHFATSCGGADAVNRLIALYDPVALWSPAVIRALSDVGGQPIQRLLLRERATLRAVATIERASLPRRHGHALCVCHADTNGADTHGADAGSPGDTAQVPLALLARSQLAVVIVGPLASDAVDGLLAALAQATRQAGWTCPHLLFLLPPGAVWIADRIDALDWPATSTVIQRDPALTSVSDVWNALLAQWEELHPAPAPGAADVAADAGPPPGSTPVDIDLALAAPAGSAAAHAGLLPPPQRARQSLAGLLQVDGLLACAVVDARSGAVIARETREDQPVDLDLAAASSAQALRAHRLSARAMGGNDGVDELIVSAGARQLMLRTSPSHPDVFVLALLDRERADPGLARMKLLDVERRLS